MSRDRRGTRRKISKCGSSDPPHAKIYCRCPADRGTSHAPTGGRCESFRRQRQPLSRHLQRQPAQAVPHRALGLALDLCVNVLRVHQQLCPATRRVPLQCFAHQRFALVPDGRSRLAERLVQWHALAVLQGQVGEHAQFTGQRPENHRSRAGPADRSGAGPVLAICAALQALALVMADSSWKVVGFGSHGLVPVARPGTSDAGPRREVAGGKMKITGAEMRIIEDAVEGSRSIGLRCGNRAG